MVNKRDENQSFSHYNFFPKNRRGQFFLLVSMIIITLIVGLFLVSNYSKSNTIYPRVYDLRDELEIESGKVLDRGAITGNYNWSSFTSNFSSYVGNEIEIIYIVGKTGSIEVYYYNDSGQKPNQAYTPGDPIKVNVNGADYYFKLKNGENFYFIISQQIGNEIHV